MEVSDEPPEGAMRDASDAHAEPEHQAAPDGHPDPAHQSPPGSSSLDDDPEKDSATPTARPRKPWWEGHPDIEAMVARTEREIYGAPAGQPDTAHQTTPDASSLDDDAWWDRFWPADGGPIQRHELSGGDALVPASSLDDDPDKDSATPTARPKPWWDGHPDIEAMVARTEREIYGRPERPAIDYPDPVLADVFSGTSIRELRDARDDLERAKVRYENSVRAARNVGLSWGQIGGILGISRQQLHRRYRNLTDC